MPLESENNAVYRAFLEPDRIDFREVAGAAVFVCVGLALVFNAFGDLARTPQPFAQGLGLLTVLFFGRNLVEDLRPVFERRPLGLRADRSGLVLRRYGSRTKPARVLWHEIAAVVKVEIGSEQPRAWLVVRFKDPDSRNDIGGMHGLVVPFVREAEADPDRDLIMPLDRLRQFDPDRLAAAIRMFAPDIRFDLE